MAVMVPAGKGAMSARGKRRRLSDFCLTNISAVWTKMHMTAVHGKIVQTNQMKNWITKKI
jgi:hypothetical protein